MAHWTSLAELAQLFLKTAQAIKNKKLTRCGQRVRGCSSHFVCKFLKPMLYARSQIYLICAIRPEQRYSKYNASILEFARNVSAVKLPLQVPTWSLTEAETIERLGEQQQQERKSRQLRQLRQWQVEAYLDRGISLAALNANTKVPHFINVDPQINSKLHYQLFNRHLKIIHPDNCPPEVTPCNYLHHWTTRLC